MVCYLAPMEGLTGYVFRNVYHRHFRPFDKYFTPFVAPGTKRIFRTRELKDVLPENNLGLFVVPQILTNQPEDFIKTAQALAEFGYGEVNLNLGCPSGTVVSKGKGSGFLKNPRELKEFLEQIFEKLTVKISIKTRIGMEDPEEFQELLETFNGFLLEELIIHPRLSREQYRGKPNLEVFGYAMEKSVNPVCYNGNLFKASDVEAFRQQFPDTERIMLGRGLVGNPGLLNEVYGDSALEMEKLADFHRDLVEEYRKALLGDKDVLFRMKELWFYMSPMFSDSEKYGKKVKKSQDLDSYLRIMDSLFKEQKILEGAGFFFE